MLYALLTFLLLLTTAWAGVATFYLYRWTNIILMLEEDLSEAAEVHERSVGMFDKIINMPLFFDSPEVRPILEEALNDVKVCRMATQKLVNTFTARSKRKYVRYVESKRSDEADGSDDS